ncbi:MAG: PadR family transcriptional regulator [Acidobacteriota bacterium]
MDLPRWRSQLRKGAAELAVLAVIGDQEAYGIQILNRITRHDGLEITEGTLYPLLNRLQRDGKIESRWVEDEGASHPRKYYRATSEGSEMLDRMKAEWSRFSNGLDQLIEEASA